MTIQLATGKTDKAVTAASDRRLYGGTIGTESYVQKVGNQCAATLDGPNKLIVQNGSAMHNGAHIDFLGNTEFVIPTGLQGKKRATICGAYIEAHADGSESIQEKTYTGDPVDSGEVPDPEYPTGNLLNGDTETFMPLYRVVTDGINALEPVPLFNVLTPAAEFQTEEKARWDSISQDLGNGVHLIRYPDGYAECEFTITQVVGIGTTPVNFTPPAPFRSGAYIGASATMYGNPNIETRYKSFHGSSGQVFVYSDQAKEAAVNISVRGYLA